MSLCKITQVFKDSVAGGDGLAQLVAEASAKAISERGIFTIAISSPATSSAIKSISCNAQARCLRWWMVISCSVAVFSAFWRMRSCLRASYQGPCYRLLRWLHLANSLLTAKCNAVYDSGEALFEIWHGFHWLVSTLSLKGWWPISWEKVSLFGFVHSVSGSVSTGLWYYQRLCERQV